ncbi:hypothetical protein GCM10007939_00350 [Amylibacter marinus]|uniref:Beta-lactamase-related domain-containing protein n=2 Tax=Amylibacter marinus TaxID=1475483 RepID=A0ABQ5VRL5_9RHOB|nr:hypothetical protein GCM10007939_00350 [Amylibacter marinus]
MDAALANWAKQHGVANTTMTVFKNGELLSPTKSVPVAKEVFALASLSKSITGMCILDLIEQKKLHFTTPLGAVFGKRLQGLKLNDTHNANITIAQLLTQTSGLGPDSTQSRMGKWLYSKRDRHEQISKHALGRESQQGTSGKFQYNNENYAILGAVIEKVTAQGYMQYCRKQVLEPHGISTAGLSPRFGAYGAMGGWEMSTADFARFVIGNLSSTSKYAAAPFDTAAAAVDGGVFYGAGVFFRKSTVGHNFWHHGAVCLGEREQVGAFFAFWQGKLGVVVGYDRCPDWNMMIELDQSLAQVAFARQ